MPILPLTDPEPFMATLGVMLYPGEDAAERSKSKAFAAQAMAEPLRQAIANGHDVRKEVLQKYATEGGEVLDDLRKRWKKGIWIGNLMKAWFALACSHPELASWSNVAIIGEKVAGANTGVLSTFKSFKKSHGSVGHLWAAWVIRGEQLKPDEKVGYDALSDFQSFLAESEILRDWGQNWKHSAANSPHPLPKNSWQVPDDWQLEETKPGWPQRGCIPYLSLPSHLLTGLAVSGRVPK